jgi:hypothetical protein
MEEPECLSPDEINMAEERNKIKRSNTNKMRHYKKTPRRAEY